MSALKDYFVNPLFLRELIYSSRRPRPGRKLYPGLGWQILANLLPALWFAWGIYAGDYPLSSERSADAQYYYLLAALWSSWILFYRSGLYAVVSMAKEVEQQSFAVLKSTPLGTERLAAGKLLTVLLPQWGEQLFVLIFVYLFYVYVGGLNAVLPLAVLFLQLSASFMMDALGLLWGTARGDSKKIITSYTKTYVFTMLGSFVGLLYIADFYIVFWSLAFFTVQLLPCLFPQRQGLIATMGIVLTITLIFMSWEDVTPQRDYLLLNPIITLKRLQVLDDLQYLSVTDNERQFSFDKQYGTSSASWLRSYLIAYIEKNVLVLGPSPDPQALKLAKLYRNQFVKITRNSDSIRPVYDSLNADERNYLQRAAKALCADLNKYNHISQSLILGEPHLTKVNDYELLLYYRQATKSHPHLKPMLNSAYQNFRLMEVWAAGFIYGFVALIALQMTKRRTFALN